ncbi:HNH endonuclease [Enterobacter hormaechei]|uniref:HNH endonuclease n=1 Tax=Enterobacter hormaechei TaxID=158836 RepID=UPI0020753908|nr:hypothetical protein [Enterobacter hormaechei]EKW1882493.1 hypothetical protein [Enterobacter hormaechei]MCM7132208.1 hypothetical protein [Enterobacter hormaechei]MCO0820446.1 hypothetical protein [Enterobacter hormaechei]HCA5753586.1 hypothetical protein [Enterobacter hormaechei]HCA6693048.1 hypothetical protein [Enterobacter hormaechei]
MRTLSKPKNIDSIKNGIDISSAVRTLLSFDEPEGISSLRKDEASLMAELIKYDYEMKQNGYLNHDSVRNFIKHKTALEWIYSRPSKKRKTAFIDAIRQAYADEGILCPYCGVSPCRTLDHYYSKALLPQFSFLPENLIPCCGDCNRDKGSKKAFSKWRRFYNPFYDDYSVFESDEPLLIIIFKENPHPNVDMNYIITANHNLPYLTRKHINYHINAANIARGHYESISNSFWRVAQDLINYRKLLNSRSISEQIYDSLLNMHIKRNDNLSYDWEFIIRYSLVKIQVNSWIYRSNSPKLDLGN